MPDLAAARSIGAGRSDEPLVPASTAPHWRVWPVYARWGVPGALNEIWVRQRVFDRLVAAAAALPAGYGLCLLDGWRPQAVQSHLYDALRDRLRSLRPEAVGDEIERAARRYAAPADDDPVQPSPHLTGGAVDLTLIDRDGRFLDMGSRFDEASPRSATDHYADGPIAGRRSTLRAAMEGAGFTNLPSEWWHFDYGNWCWAWYAGRREALYGPLPMIGEAKLWQDVDADARHGRSR